MNSDKRLEEIRKELTQIGLIRGERFHWKAQAIWDLAHDLLETSATLRAEAKATREQLSESEKKRDYLIGKGTILQRHKWRKRSLERRRDELLHWFALMDNPEKPMAVNQEMVKKARLTVVDLYEKAKEARGKVLRQVIETDKETMDEMRSMMPAAGDETHHH